MIEYEEPLSKEQIALELRGFADGDYIQNNIIYCGVCGAAKETMQDTENGTIYFPVVHWHDVRERNKAGKQNGMKANCFDGSDVFAKATLDDLHAPKSIELEARNFINAFNAGERKGLLLFGGVGVGKSYLAAALCNRLIHDGVKCKFTSLRQIIQDTQGFGEASKAMKKLLEFEVIVLDDFATERNTAYGYERVFDIVDTLYRAQKTLIVTTNLTREAIAKSSDPRIMDRLKEICHCVEYTGENKRQTKMKG